MSKVQGLTFPELLIVLLIFSIAFAFSLPVTQSFYQKNQLKKVEEEIVFAIQYARNQALMKGESVKIAPLDVQNWSLGIMLLRQQDNQLLHQWTWKHRGITVQWTGFQSQKFLQFSSRLDQFVSNGHFLLTTKQGLQEKLILNRFGRVSVQML